MKWLARDLIRGPFLFLATSEKAYHRAMSHCAIPMSERPVWVNKGKHATAHAFVSSKGDRVSIVAIDAGDATPIEICGLLVHEAVHVWQRHCEDVGEANPSIEFEAYAVQAIAQRLMQQYADEIA